MASGKYSFGFCDKTGFRYPTRDLVEEFRNGAPTGMRVGRDVVDADHPQNFVGRVRTDDNQSLDNPRPDSSLAESRALRAWNPVGHPSVFMTGRVGRVTVTTT